MPPPTPLSIATSSLNRLVREELSYHKEQRQQEAAIEKLEAQIKDDGDDKENGGAAAAEEEEEAGNREFALRQQKKALEETKAVFPALRERIVNAKENLEALMEQYPKGSSDDDDPSVTAAREALANCKSIQISNAGLE